MLVKAMDVLQEYSFEVQCVACWEGSTRENEDKTLFRVLLMQINSGYSRLNNPDKEKLLESINVLVQIQADPM
jgi:hypothetical protein